MSKGRSLSFSSLFSHPPCPTVYQPWFRDDYRAGTAHTYSRRYSSSTTEHCRSHSYPELMREASEVLKCDVPVLVQTVSTSTRTSTASRWTDDLSGAGSETDMRLLRVRVLTYQVYTSTLRTRETQQQQPVTGTRYMPGSLHAVARLVRAVDGSRERGDDNSRTKHSSVFPQCSFSFILFCANRHSYVHPSTLVRVPGTYHTAGYHFSFFLFPFPPHLLSSSPFFSSPYYTAVVVSQMRGHKAGSSPFPPTPTVLALEGFFIEKVLQPFLPSSTHFDFRLPTLLLCRRSPLFVCFYKSTQKFDPGGIRLPA